mgnify:FL=1
MEKTKKYILRFFMVIFGASVYSAGTVFFNKPHSLAPGGLSGFAIVLNAIFQKINFTFFGREISVGAIVVVLNVPLIAVGLWKFGKEFLVGTVFGTLTLALTTDLFERLYADVLVPSGADWFIVKNDILAALAGGVFMAVGLGVVFKAGATTGGTDIILKLLKLKFRHMQSGRIFLCIDSLIVLSSLPVVNFRIEKILLSFIGMVSCSLVLDLILYGRDGAKLVYIVSDKTPEIAQKLLKELCIGATFLDGVGAYTGVKKEVIMCVVKKISYPKLKDLVSVVDPHAFLIVSSASEVYGAGYKNSFKQEL